MRQDHGIRGAGQYSAVLVFSETATHGATVLHTATRGVIILGYTHSHPDSDAATSSTLCRNRGAILPRL